MKKKISIFIFLLIVISGCSKNEKMVGKDSDSNETNKVLICTAKEDYDNYYKFEDVYTFYFDKNGMSLQKFNESEKFLFGSELSEKDKSDSYNQLLQQCDEFNKYAGVECTVDKEEQGFLVSVTITVANLDNNGREEFLLYSSYDEWKKYLEDDEYVCKK